MADAVAKSTRRALRAAFLIWRSCIGSHVVCRLALVAPARLASQGQAPLVDSAILDP
jgi:hypothetical protein